MSSNFAPKCFRLECLVAFLFGFLMAFVTFLCYDRYLIWSVQLEQHTTASEHYQTGYMAAMQDIESEGSYTHEQLKKDIRVLCMVFTFPANHDKRAVHIKATWGRRCTKLIFMSSVLNETLNAIPVIEEGQEKYFKLWNKTREAFRYVYEKYFHDYDWFLKADDDTYIVMENLRHMLYPYPTKIPISFGYKMKRYGVEYMSGGSSYVLSREALHRFMKFSYHNKENCPTADLTGPEDFYMGVCLQNAGVLMADSRFSGYGDSKTKYLPLELFAYTEPNWNETIPDWYIEMSTQTVELGLNCCSNYTVAFHYTDPAKIYAFEFLIYHFRVFGLHRTNLENLPEILAEENIYKKFILNQTKINYEQIRELYDNF